MPAEDGEIQGFDEHLGALLLGHRAYFEHYGTDSFLSATVNVHAGECFTDLFSRACDALEQKLNRARRKRATPGYSLMLRIRNSIYMNPTEELSIEHFCKQYAYSAGHIRAMYRECFEISFHRDCICSRITMAKNLLCLSEISVSEISKLCGYNDSKYFFRQFRLVTGLSATQYRELFRRNGDSEGGSCDARWTKWNR